MQTPKSLLVLLPITWLAACSSTVEEQRSNAAQLTEKAQVAETVDTPLTESTCPVLISKKAKSEKWYAWLDRESVKGGQYRLNVNGEITLPNPGFDIHWSVGPTDRMHPPGLRLFLTPTPSNQMSIQVLTALPVQYHMDTPFARFRHVSIYCAGKQLAQIKDVVLTD